MEYLAPAETVKLVDGDLKVVIDEPQTVKHVDGDLKIVDDPSGAVLALDWAPAEKLTPKEKVKFNSYWVERLDPTFVDRDGKSLTPEEFAEMKAEWDQKPALELDYEDRFYSGRNYRLFELLAGVRGDPEEAFWEDRGFPEDASNEVREDYEEWGVDAHTPSWQTLDELTAQDWVEPFTDSTGYWGREWAQTLDRLIDLANEKCGGDQTAVRIIYWFDN